MNNIGVPDIVIGLIIVIFIFLITWSEMIKSFYIKYFINKDKAIETKVALINRRLNLIATTNEANTIKTSIRIINDNIDSLGRIKNLDKEISKKYVNDLPVNIWSMVNKRILDISEYYDNELKLGNIKKATYLRNINLLIDQMQIYDIYYDGAKSLIDSKIKNIDSLINKA